MLSINLLQAILLIFGAVVVVADSKACENGYQVCNPAGQKATAVPQISGAFGPIYVDILNSIANSSKSIVADMANIMEVRDLSTPMCCISGTTCLLVEQLEIPFCYDHFTTNYFLPDGSYGTLITGDYTAVDGSHANLLSGDYELVNGTTGNLYDNAVQNMPNTSTLPMPTAFTSKGVGSAIPASELGGQETFTTTISGTTVEATTRPARIVLATTISGSTYPASTEPASTVPGTTVGPLTTVITTSIVTSTVSEMTKVPSSIKENGAADQRGGGLSNVFLTLVALIWFC